MAQQVINVGISANDGLGDPIRTAYQKCNSNFSQLYSRAQTNPPTSLQGTVGDQAGMYAYDSNYFYYCFANYTGNSVIWAEISQSGNSTVTSITNGTSNVSIPTINGNVTIGINGTGNVTTIAVDGQYITGKVSASGNITGSYILGNGSQLTGLPSSYSNSNVSSFLSTSATNIIPASNVGYVLGNSSNQWNSIYTAAITSNSIVATGLANVASLAVQTSASFGNNISAGNMTVTGTANFGDAYFTGNVTLPGNINQISGNSGQFFGNATTGFGALYAGIPVGYANLANAVLQSSTNYNGYAEVNIQNINAGAQASSDYVATADTGTETSQYINMGITSSTWDGTQPTSLGNALGQHDGYLYVDGGDLVVGTVTAGAFLKINSGGPNVANQVATFRAVGTTANSAITGAFTLIGGAGITGNVYASGNIVAGSGSYFLGDGGLLGNISAGNIVGGYSNANVANYLPTYSGNVGNSSSTGYIFGNGSQLTGLPATYANSNVQTYLASNANVVLSTTGNITTTANISGNYILGNGALLSGIAGGTPTQLANGTSNVNAATANSNISVGINGTSNVVVWATTGEYVTGVVSASGNITGSYLIGNGSQLTGLSTYGDSNVTVLLASGTVSTVISTSGNVVAGNVRTSGQVSATGNITGGNLSVGTGTVTLNNIINAGANTTGNIGSSSNYFNTVFAQASSALYADLAENYLADAQYEPGTVLEFGGEFEVTLAEDETRRVAGVVSTNPAYLMNSGLTGDNIVSLALTGRVPCKVRGDIRKGDMLVSGGGGYARPTQDAKVGTVIGKALQDFTGTGGVIEIVVGRI